MAELHTAKGTKFGLDFDGSYGPLPQINTPVQTNTWSDFFRTRRIEPFLAAALSSGSLPDGFVTRIHAIAEHLENFGGPDPLPSLLHGDAQQNNFLSTDGGALLVDASPFYGHPENDLAMLDIFAPVPIAVSREWNAAGR